MIGAQINTVLQAISAQVSEAYRHHGFVDIRPSHLGVLRNLWPTGRRIGDLATRVGITKASVVYLVNELEERGYVERHPDLEDQRATLVQLSQRGWAAHRVARAAVQRIQDEWTQAVGEPEMETFLATLARIAALANETPTAPTNRLKGRHPQEWQR